MGKSWGQSLSHFPPQGHVRAQPSAALHSRGSLSALGGSERGLGSLLGDGSPQSTYLWKPPCLSEPQNGAGGTIAQVPRGNQDHCSEPANSGGGESHFADSCYN